MKCMCICVENLHPVGDCELRDFVLFCLGWEGEVKGDSRGGEGIVSDCTT
jgi:hypothetical protein